MVRERNLDVIRNYKWDKKAKKNEKKKKNKS
jgi:hypothetical protein